MEISLIEQKIKEIFLTVFPDEDSSILTMNKQQSEFENWDSFAHLRLVSEIEKQFDLRLDIDEVMNINSPNDFLNLVNKKKK
tara:strand:+ start:244 stop:489 length:246 start_codon:yes stop_codon:yes gene_type:complete